MRQTKPHSSIIVKQGPFCSSVFDVFFDVVPNPRMRAKDQKEGRMHHYTGILNVF